MKSKMSFGIVILLALGTFFTPICIANNVYAAGPDKNRGPTPVIIENDPANPVPVSTESYPRVPFQKAMRLQFPDKEGDVWGSFLVPAGKRLVIETVSLRGAVPLKGDQQIIQWGIQTISGNEIMTHGLSVSPTATLPGTINARWYSCSNQTRLYANPGTEVKGWLARYPTDGEPGFFMFISGYLVSLHSPSLAP